MRLVSRKIAFLPLTILVLMTPVVSRVHADGKGDEVWILSKYVGRNLELTFEEGVGQWAGAYEIDAEQEDQTIEVLSVNNGTVLLFALIWDDPTNSKEDGAAVFFEEAGAEGEDEVAYWSAQPFDLENHAVAADGRWENNQWLALIEVALPIGSNPDAMLGAGQSREDFVKFAVWDGAQNESLENIDAEELEHANVAVLPFIDDYPKDVYVWSGIILGAALVFTASEVRRHRWRE